MALKPMNCPGHCQLYLAAAALLPRPAGALLGAGPAAPQRAERHAARPAARAPLRPGRRATSSAPRTRSRRRSPASCSSRSTPTSCSASTCSLELSTRPEKRIGSDELWDKSEAALKQRARRARARVHDQRGRRRLLRPEDRHAHDRLARPLLAARHLPARLQLPGALRPDLHRRRQRRAPAGDDPPRADGLLRALHRHPARALLRRAAGLAGAAAGDRAADRRPPQRVRGVGAGRAWRRRACASSSTTAPSRWAARSATPRSARSRSCWSSATASRTRARSACASIGPETRARSRWTTSWRASQI